MEWEKHLNKQQLKAVTTPSQYVRVIAGAGSGKTRVLTYRLAYLIKEIGAAPWRTLAITFTNKAAKEMQERTMSLLPGNEVNLNVMTFHSFCARFLREEAQLIGYPRNFTIYDEDDQQRLIKSIVTRYGYKKNDKIVGEALRFIGMLKTDGLYPDDIDLRKYPYIPDRKTLLEIWKDYETALNNAFALDFDDLLAKVRLILINNEETRTKWQNRFDHILIDEFQDTNDVQYDLVENLLKSTTNLYVVGDPDQTIYTWRGANQDILTKMERQFPSVETIILNRNYRSTQNILSAANKLIAHNKDRIKKDLYTEAGSGEKIVQNNALTDRSEAEWVAQELMALKISEPGFSYRDIAILYRSAYLTAPIERVFMTKRIPYVVYGGIRFYARAEVKDVVAYWRMLVNRKDDVAFTRIINTPKRGIGDKTLATLVSEARKQEYSLYEYILYLEDDAPTDLRPNAKRILKDLVLIMESYRERIEAGLEAASEVANEYIEKVGYYKYLKEDEERGEERLENVAQLIQELYAALKEGQFTTFAEYIQNVTMYTSQDEMGNEDRVTLMTVHVAKGLEYPYVFIIGLNDGVFPNHRSLDGGLEALEEERRLAYVAFTRAQKRLYLSCSNEYSYVLSNRKQPSPFFKEAGLEFPRFSSRFEFGRRYELPTKESDGGETRDFFAEPSEVADWQIGDLAQHRVFGRGIVKKIIDNTILEIKFDDYGIKKIMANHHAVEKIVLEGDLS